jgi:hypothetical protein
VSPVSLIDRRDLKNVLILYREQGVEENIWTKGGWSDGRVEKAA